MYHRLCYILCAALWGLTLLRVVGVPLPNLAELAVSIADSTGIEIQNESGRASLAPVEGEPAEAAPSRAAVLGSENDELIKREQEVLRKIEVHSGYGNSGMFSSWVKAVFKPSERQGDQGTAQQPAVRAGETVISPQRNAPEGSLYYVNDQESLADGGSDTMRAEAVSAVATEQGLAEGESSEDFDTDSDNGQVVIDGFEYASLDQTKSRFGDYGEMDEDELALTIREQRNFFEGKLDYLDQQIAKYENQQLKSEQYEGMLVRLKKFEGKLKALHAAIGELTGESASLRRAILGTDDQTIADNFRPARGRRTLVPVLPDASQGDSGKDHLTSIYPKEGLNAVSLRSSDLPSAVVSVAHSPVRTEPGKLATDIVHVMKGTELKVERVRGNWLRVETPTGVKGWIGADALNIEEI